VIKLAHVAQWKYKEVENLVELLQKYPVIGIVEYKNIPAKQIQEMRTLLRGKVKIRVAKITLMKIAIDKIKKKNISELKRYLRGQVALVLSDEDPFRVTKLLEENRTRRIAKSGEVVTQDIIIPKGETDFPPGPIVGDLQMLNIPARIERGKVVILEDAPIIRAGETVTPKIAEILSRFDIRPIEIGFRIITVYEDGILYPPEILHISVEEYKDRIARCARECLNISVNATIFNRYSIEPIIINAFEKSRNLAINAVIFEKEVMPDIIRTAISMANSINALSCEKEEKVEEKKEEKKEEEKKEEEKESDIAAGLGALFG